MIPSNSDPWVPRMGDLGLWLFLTLPPAGSEPTFLPPQLPETYMGCRTLCVSFYFQRCLNDLQELCKFKRPALWVGRPHVHSFLPHIEMKASFFIWYLPLRASGSASWPFPPPHVRAQPKQTH